MKKFLEWSNYEKFLEWSNYEKRMPKDPVTGPLYKHAWNTCF